MSIKERLARAIKALGELRHDAKDCWCDTSRGDSRCCTDACDEAREVVRGYEKQKDKE